MEHSSVCELFLSTWIRKDKGDIRSTIVQSAVASPKGKVVEHWVPEDLAFRFYLMADTLFGKYPQCVFLLKGLV